MRTVMVLSDGTEISSGIGKNCTVKKCRITECVNQEEELRPGSVCCVCAEITVLSVNGTLSIANGTRFTLYKEKASGTRQKVGIFLAEKPARISAHIYKITAYDKVSLLDKDLTGKLTNLGPAWEDTGYVDMGVLAYWVCDTCGLTLVSTNFNNSGMPVYPFTTECVTGRQIMQWIGELSGCFCRATTDGTIEFAEYTSKGVTLRRTGDRFYYCGSLIYEDYNVMTIDGIRSFMNGEPCTERNASGAVNPGALQNPYAISPNNLIWIAGSGRSAVREQGGSALAAKLAQIGRYRPCKVSVPACTDIHAGDIVSVVTPSGNTLRVLVMTKVQNGARDTITCTGSPSYYSSTALNNR